MFNVWVSTEIDGNFETIIGGKVGLKSEAISLKSELFFVSNCSVDSNKLISLRKTIIPFMVTLVFRSFNPKYINIFYSLSLLSQQLPNRESDCRLWHTLRSIWRLKNILAKHWTDWHSLYTTMCFDSRLLWFGSSENH